jgi:hypothetical protein
MFLTILLIDFFHEDWSARCCELRSQGQPFRVHMGDYRPLPVSATRLDIGAQRIFGDPGATILDGPCDPVDRWLAKSDDSVKFEIEYSGVTPPMTGEGVYNLVLPFGWRFKDIQINNPNYSRPGYEIARDYEGDREALILYFEGLNTRFNLTIQAARSSRESDRQDFGVPVYSRSIVEPSVVMSTAELAAINAVLSYWETGTRLRNLTHATDPFDQGLAESVKRWRRVCQDAIKVLQPGMQRDMVREGQEAAIPVEIRLDRILSGKDPSSFNSLDKAIKDMQRRIEDRMQALAQSVDRSLEPRRPERY